MSAGARPESDSQLDVEQPDAEEPAAELLDTAEPCPARAEELGMEQPEAEQPEEEQPAAEQPAEQPHAEPHGTEQLDEGEHEPYTHYMRQPEEQPDEEEPAEAHAGSQS